MSGDPDSERCMQSAQLLVPVTERDHSIGPSNAVVTLVEYGDFECSFCRKAYSMLQGLRRYMGDNLRFVYRHFPLAEAHPHAQHAAEAAEAAGAQGKFWEMHDMLFHNRDALEDADLLTYAANIGIDAQRMARELAAGTYTKKVRDDFRGGVRSGVNGTPTFFVNGVRYDGNWSDTDAFIQVLTDAATHAEVASP